MVLQAFTHPLKKSVRQRTGFPHCILQHESGDCKYKDCSMHCAIMIQIAGWNCTSGLCTCEMKENIFVILLFGQYDIDTFDRIGTVNSVRTGLLKIDS